MKKSIKLIKSLTEMQKREINLFINRNEVSAVRTGKI